MVGRGLQAEVRRGPGLDRVAKPCCLVRGSEQQTCQGHLLIYGYCSAFPGEVQQDLTNCGRERPESAEKQSLS